jgi:hypothetical protein
MNTAEQVTPAEFARLTGLSLGYVYNQLWSGKLSARKVDGQWAIPVTEVDRRNQRRGLTMGDEKEFEQFTEMASLQGTGELVKANPLVKPDPTKENAE